MHQPRKIWWARPRKLCFMERPGGGGRSHRPERRALDLAYLRDSGVRTIVSTMQTRHNLADYEALGFEWVHAPVGDWVHGLEELLGLLRRHLRGRGAVAVHGNRHTDFLAALGAVHLHYERGTEVEEGLRAALAAGLSVTPEAAELVGVAYEAVQPRSRIASSTSSGRSVTT